MAAVYCSYSAQDSEAVESMSCKFLIVECMACIEVEREAHSRRQIAQVYWQVRAFEVRGDQQRNDVEEGYGRSRDGGNVDRNGGQKLL